jgi:hypothetical protein
VGRQAVEHQAVIVVEPLALLGCEHVSDDGSLVNGTKGERLELQEAAELRLFVGNVVKYFLKWTHISICHISLHHYFY